MADGNRLPRLLQVNVSRGSGDVPIWRRARLLLPGQTPEPVTQPRQGRPQRHRPGAPFGLPSEGVRPEANEYPNHVVLPLPRGFLGQPQGFLGQPQGGQGAGEGGQQALQTIQAVNQVVQQPPQGSGQGHAQGSGQGTSRRPAGVARRPSIEFGRLFPRAISDPESVMREPTGGVSRASENPTVMPPMDRVVTRSETRRLAQSTRGSRTRPENRPSKKSGSVAKKRSKK